MAQILTLAEAAGHPVGGKAEGLARLQSMGLRVPPTLILIGAQEGDHSTELLERVRDLGEGRLAVRSSALG